MLAWPAKGKLVKPVKAWLPRPRAEQPFGRGNDSHSGDPGCRPDRLDCAASPLSKPVTHREWEQRGKSRRAPTVRGRRWWTLVVGNAQDIPFGAAATEPCQQGTSAPDGLACAPVRGLGMTGAGQEPAHPANRLQAGCWPGAVTTVPFGMKIS